MDALEMLEEKISKAVSLIEKLNLEKKELSGENEGLKSRLKDLENKIRQMERHEVGRTETVKEKLTGILGKLETLEQF